jgi:hypothetical protein
MIARRLTVRQARVRYSARYHREVFPTEHTSDYVLYECNVCYNI